MELPTHDELKRIRLRVLWLTRDNKYNNNNGTSRSNQVPRSDDTPISVDALGSVTSRFLSIIE